jgi:peptidoglycan/LPS O-acetylase OafA/YrhL
MARELSFEAFQQRRHVLALDGLRALAIIGVLLHHTRHKPFALVHGFRGVWVFFVLSGFLITTLALREEARAGRLDIRAFMIRRVFRILPLYYLALAAYLVWVFVLQMEPDGASRFAYYMPNFLFYAPEFPIFQHHFEVPFGQAWSLGIEEKFYLVWPFLAFGLLAHSRHRLWVTLVLIAVTATLTVNGGWLAQMWGSYTDILIGCLVAQSLHQRAIYERLAVLGRTGIAWAVFVALAVATLIHGPGTQLAERVFSLLAAVTLIALVTNQRGPATLLSTPWLVRIGIWSYAIYLTHTIVFDIVNPLLPAGRAGDCLTLVAMLAIDLPICWLLHVSVEKPLIRVGKRLAARRRAPELSPDRDSAGETSTG